MDSPIRFTDRDPPPSLVPELARVVEDLDAQYGIDSAPYSVTALMELCAPDVAYRVLLHIGVPGPEALDMVLVAADDLGQDRAIVLALVMRDVWQ